MKFRISQGFETLGDPCAETVESREAAEAAAAQLRGEIAEMVAGWETPDSDDETSPTGYSTEIDAWAHAATLAAGIIQHARDSMRSEVRCAEKTKETYSATKTMKLPTWAKEVQP